MSDITIFFLSLAAVMSVLAMLFVIGLSWLWRSLIRSERDHPGRWDEGAVVWMCPGCREHSRHISYIGGEPYCPACRDQAQAAA